MEITERVQRKFDQVHEIFGSRATWADREMNGQLTLFGPQLCRAPLLETLDSLGAALAVMLIVVPWLVIGSLIWLMA